MRAGLRQGRPPVRHGTLSLENHPGEVLEVPTETDTRNPASATIDVPRAVRVLTDALYGFRNDVVAAVLHAGDVDFEATGDGDACRVSEATRAALTVAAALLAGARA